jgi:antitoxin HigA-1
VNRSEAKHICSLKHPGQVLATFIEPYGISQNSLSRSMGVSPRRINEILQGKRAITADTAIGLDEVFGSGALYWMRLQALYDLAVARLQRQDRPAPELEVFRDGAWDECSADCVEDDEYLAALRRGRLSRSSRRAKDSPARGGPWLDDREAPDSSRRRGARRDDGDE